MTAVAGPSSVLDERFVLEQQARRGGMGTVWKARDLRSGSAVALKLLHDTGAEQCRRFLREGQLLAELVHPNIVGYVAHGALDASTPYLAMEWLEGETLAERLERGPLQLSETLTLLRSALDGLAFAHRLGVVHRDLKPSNLFLREGSVERVVLLDLGLARTRGNDSGLTRTGSILGTPGYMAPEQAQGEREISSAADVFSLGCVLFECLTGAPPFVASHVLAVLAKVLFQPAPRVRVLRPELPASLDALLERALQKDPRKRLPDAQALLAELDALADSPTERPSTERVSAEQPSPSDAEQELVAVILVSGTGTPASAQGSAAEGGATLAATNAAPSPWSDVSAYGGELRHLADGTTIIVVAQRGGAATDLTARAARCALHLRAVLPELRCTLATGRGIARERSYVGSAVERAVATLGGVDQQPAGSIWLDETTSHLLAPRFRCSRVEQASATFALEHEEATVDPARMLLGKPTPCVGRERELGTLALSLHACLDEATPQATLVVGAPGVGKSRLRHEFLRRSQLEHQLTVLLGLGDPIRSAATCGLLGQALGRLCGLHSDATAEESHRLLAARVGGQLPNDNGLTLAFLAELCGLPEAGTPLPELRAARKQPNVMLERLTQSWLTFVRAEAARQPLLIVLDDLQWCDALSIGLIDATLRQSALRVLVLALGRPETPECFPGLWSPRLSHLPLQPLSAAATRRLIREVLGDQLGDDSAERIIAHAGGNALYLEELIRAAGTGSEAAPETVLAMLQARIGLLPPAARRVLRAASVFGEFFPLAGVAALLTDATARAELPALLALLDKQELLEPRSSNWSGQQLRFHHALLRDAAYALIPEQDLRSSHLLAAHYLESVEEDPVVIASHFERGGDTESAIRHYMRAAQQAHRRRDLNATLQLSQRCAQLGASGSDLGMLHNLECLASFYLHDFERAWTAAESALRLLPSGHPRRRYALAAITYIALQLGRMAEVSALIDELLQAEPDDEDRGEWTVALGYTAIAFITQANRPRARQLLDSIEQMERRAAADDVFVLGQVCYWSVRFQVLLGDEPARTLVLARRGAALLEQAGDLQITCAMWAEVGECTRRSVSLSRSLPDFRKGVALAHACRDKVSRAFVSTYLANALADLATPESIAEARALSQEILTLTAEGSAYRGLGHVSCALTALAAGELAEAEAHARMSRAEIGALGLRAYLPHPETALLRVLLARGDIAAAESVADEALRNVDEHGPLGSLEPALRVAAARARLAAGRPSEALADVERALGRLQVKLGQLEPPERAVACREVPENAELIALAETLGARAALAALHDVVASVTPVQAAD